VAGLSGAGACIQTMTVSDSAYMLVKPGRMRDMGYVVAAESSEVSLDERMAARAALRRACEVLGLDASRIRVRWFHSVTGDTPGAMRTRSGEVIRGQFTPVVPDRIEIRVGLRLADLQRTVLHEVRHLAQQLRWGLLDGPEDRVWRERDASRWADEMMRSKAA
jgi:hypothetical protein